MGIGKMDKFEEYTFVKGLEGLTSEKKHKKLLVNTSNKNDTIKFLGNPSTKGMTNDSLWIYIERTRTRGKLLKLGRSHLKKNNVLVLEFSKLPIKQGIYSITLVIGDGDINNQIFHAQNNYSFEVVKNKPEFGIIDIKPNWYLSNKL